MFVPKIIKIALLDQDNLHTKFSALNVDFFSQRARFWILTGRLS